MPTYHVTLDGQGYLIDLATYQREARSLAPNVEQVRHHTQQSWAGGIDDSDLWDPRHPDRAAEAVALEAFRGPIGPGRALTSRYNPGVGTTDFGGLIVYAGQLYAWERTSGKIHRSADGVTWAQLHDFGGTGLACAALFDGAVLFGSLNTGAIFRYDGATFSTWLTLAVSNGVTALYPAYQDGLLYAGHQNTSGHAVLVKINTTPTATTVATHKEAAEITAILALGPKVWYAAMHSTGGIRGWLYAYDFVDALVSLQTEIPDNAITALAVWRDQLVAGSRTRGKVWTLQQPDPVLQLAGLRELWTVPDQVAIGGISGYGLRMWQLAVDSDRLHVPVVDAQGLGTYVTQDGAGWFLPHTGGLGQEPRGCVAFGGKLYLSTKSNAGARIYEVASAYPTSATLLTPWFDDDALGVAKTFLALTLFHSALNANESLTVDYALDGATGWTSLGVSDTDGARSKTLTFPAGTTGQRIRFRVVFALVTTSAAPVLEQLDLEWAEAEASVARKSTWSFDALFEGTAELPQMLLDHAPNPKTGAQLSDAAWATKAKTTTVSFTDLDGAAYTVWVDGLQETVSPRSQREGLSTRGRFALREA